MTLKHRSITAKILLPTMTLLIFSMGCLIYYENHSSDKTLRQGALHSAISVLKSIRTAADYRFKGKTVDSELNIFLSQFNQHGSMSFGYVAPSQLAQQDAREFSIEAFQLFQRENNSEYFSQFESTSEGDVANVALPHYQGADIAGIFTAKVNLSKMGIDGVNQSNVWLISCALILLVGALLARLTNSEVKRPLSHINEQLESRAHSMLALSRRLADSSHELAGAASQQAAAGQQTVSAMSQMSSMIDQTTEFSQNSGQIARKVRDRTEEGGAVMHEMVSSMELIQQSNTQLQEMEKIIEEISKKTKIINDIVFKTQLLSFNASIEAARAGEHGKGFAVVAEEVGNLAQMSGKAAQEIRTLLDDSHQQVNEIVESTKQRISAGETVSQKAMDIFNKIFGDVETISDHIAKISTASREQAEGIRKTQQAVNQLDQTTGENNVIANNTAQVSEQIKDMSNNLVSIIGTLQELIKGQTAEHCEYNPEAPPSQSENIPTNAPVAGGKSTEDPPEEVELSVVDSLTKNAKAASDVDLDEDLTADDDDFKRTA